MRKNRFAFASLFLVICSILPVAACTGEQIQNTPTPTMCTGWQCTLEVILYQNEASTGNELPGQIVHFEQVSNCSPTAGETEFATNKDGRFSVNIYLHDTDSLWIDIEEQGFQSVRKSIGGFDCLACSCSPIEIILEPIDP